MESNEGRRGKGEKKTTQLAPKITREKRKRGKERYLLNRRRLAGLGHHHEPNWSPSQLSNDVIDPGRIFLQVLWVFETNKINGWRQHILFQSLTMMSSAIFLTRKGHEIRDFLPVSRTHTHRHTHTNTDTKYDDRQQKMEENRRSSALIDPYPPPLSLSLSHTHTHTLSHYGPWHTEQRFFLFLPWWRQPMLRCHFDQTTRFLTLDTQWWIKLNVESTTQPHSHTSHTLSHTARNSRLSVTINTDLKPTHD